MRPVILRAFFLLAVVQHAPGFAEPATALERLGIAEIVRENVSTGAGVSIAIFSEIADPLHPYLTARNLRQLRMPLNDQGMPGEPQSSEPQLTLDEWHGTHIAGIIGSDCSLGESRGVACHADLTIHDFGTYGDFEFHDADDVLGVHPEAAFLRRVAGAFAVERGTEIANLSFNIEAPYIPVRLAPRRSLGFGDLLGDLKVPMDELFESFGLLLDRGDVALVEPSDRLAVEKLGEQHNDPSSLIVGMLVPHSVEWMELANAVGEFQEAGGIVVISESNNRFNGRSGVLNALPALSAQVDPTRWLSIAYVRPTDNGGFETPLNGCGQLAASFCLSVRADDILAPTSGVDGLRAESGHSMAAPMVSGLLALLIEKGRRSDASFAPHQAAEIIRKTTRRDFDGYDSHIHGVGLLDAAAALQALD